MTRFSGFGWAVWAAIFAAPAISPVWAQDAPATSSNAPASAASWTSFKGDAQRSGTTPVSLNLPLNLLWRHTTDVAPQPNASSPLVLGAAGQRRVYFAEGLAIFCTDAQTGAEIWRSADQSGVIGSPLTLLSGGDEGDLILAITSGGTLAATRTGDGSQAWQVDTGASVRNAAPIVVRTANGERIVVAQSTGQLVAFTREGDADTKWSVRLSQLGAGPSATPLLSSDGATLFVPAEDQKIYAIDVRKQTIPFVAPLPRTTYVSPAILGDRMIVSTGKTVGAYSTRTGNPLWTTPLGGLLAGSPTGRIDGAGVGQVFCGSSDGVMYALDGRRGTVLWKTDLESPVSGIPVSAPNAVVVGTRGGELFALKPGDGSILWRYRLQADGPDGGSDADDAADGADGVAPVAEGVPAEGEGGAPAPVPGAAVAQNLVTYGVSAPPSIVDGQLFLLADNASLFAFDTAPFDADPPLAVEASLSVPSQGGSIKTYLLDPQQPVLVPGRGPIYFSVELNDVGSGVDPAGTRVSIDGKEVSRDNLSYQGASGEMTAILLAAPKRGQRAINLADGAHTVVLSMRDFRGNSSDFSGTFLVDNKLPAPQPDVVAPEPGDPGGDPGGGDMGGGGGEAPA